MVALMTDDIYPTLCLFEAIFVRLEMEPYIFLTD